MGCYFSPFFEKNGHQTVWPEKISGHFQYCRYYIHCMYNNYIYYKVVTLTGIIMHKKRGLSNVLFQKGESAIVYNRRTARAVRNVQKVTVRSVTVRRGEDRQGVMEYAGAVGKGRGGGGRQSTSVQGKANGRIVYATFARCVVHNKRWKSMDSSAAKGRIYGYSEISLLIMLGRNFLLCLKVIFCVVIYVLIENLCQKVTGIVNSFRKLTEFARKMSRVRYNAGSQDITMVSLFCAVICNLRGCGWMFCACWTVICTKGKFNPNSYGTSWQSRQEFFCAWWTLICTNFKFNPYSHGIGGQMFQEIFAVICLVKIGGGRAWGMGALGVFSTFENGRD